MKSRKLKSALAVTMVATMLLVSPLTSFAAEATPAAPNDSLSGIEFEYPTTRANYSKSIQTSTGGTLTANVWLSSLYSNNLIDYQVSAQYNKTDHTNIRTEWYAVIEAESLSNSVSVTVNTTSGASVTATTTSTSTMATTASKYYENTKSQTDASYRSNIALQGKWKVVTMVNEASVWGGSIVKKTAITTQTSVYR